MDIRDLIYMFASYCNQRDQLTGKDVRETLVENEQLFWMLLNILKDSTDDDDEVCFGLITYLDLMFGSPFAAITFVNNQLKNIDLKKVDKRYKYLFAKLKKALEEAAKTNNIINLQKPTKGVQKQIMARKAHQYAGFALTQIKEKTEGNKTAKLPTVDPKVDTTEFSNYNRTQLVSLFDADNFYKLNKRQKHGLLQAIVNDYCREQGITPCDVRIINLPVSDKTICYGEYDPSKGVININKRVFDQLDNPDMANNNFLPYQLLSTTVHETRHRTQFNALTNQSMLTDKEKLITKSIKHPIYSGYNAYLSAPEELDARNSALEYLRQMCLATGDEELKAFYNSKKYAELHNGKLEIPDEIKQHFPEIYNNLILRSKKDSQIVKDSRDFYQQMKSPKTYTAESQ